LKIRSLCLRSDGSEQLVTKIEMQHIPFSDPMQLLLKKASNSAGSTIFNWAIEHGKGAILLKDRSAFERLAVTSDVSGVIGVRELKFVIVDLDSNHPILFFMDSKVTPLHYDFLRNVLKRYQNIAYGPGMTQFGADAYFSENRRHLAGSVVAYDHFSDSQNNDGSGLYTVEFWPTDPVPAKLIEQAYRTISAAMPFLPSPLAYHPVGNTHEQEYQAFSEQFAADKIRTIMTNELFGQLDTAVLNKGEAYGLLKVINPGDPSPGEDAIAIYTFIPNTLGHVGGIITEEPQTPLSHINLKARQNDTPNAYIKDVHNKSEFTALIDNWVHYTVSDDGVKLESATEAEALEWLAGLIPTEVTIPESDLTSAEPMPLSELRHADWVRVGVKAANVAELGTILPEGIPPKGYALPFALYDQFMRLTRCANDLTKLCNDQGSPSLYQHVAQLLKNQEFQQDKQVREQALAELRDIIESADASQALIDQIETVRLFWEPAGEPFSQKLRVRSSTNNEDLEGFNGAGLYDSYTHKPKEGKLIKSIKEVWASLWTDRAFEERRVHRINHLKTYMGVLIHPNYGDEQVNGVAITKNIYNPGWEGFYINAQYGEISISNPEPIETDNGLINPIPDEFIMTRLPASINGYAWETQFIRHSNIETVYDAPVSTENVLTENEIDTLRDNLRIIHSHFKELYQGDDNFAIDIEFKITETDDGSRGELAIKQARPWVD
ncbi:MAG: hypothetical protein GQ529_08515, partial [Methyloprofundus sp.]|nr:hypothetical protein [Methyloprofundus sp.]